MYLVLSALTSSPISLVAATKTSAFSFRGTYASSQYMYGINIINFAFCILIERTP